MALVLGGCSGGGDPEAPPKATSVPQFQARNSTLVVPIDMSLDNLQAALERKAPRKLWSIDKPNQKCIGGQRIRAFGANVKVTPDIDCRIVGEVTRGAIALSGSGNRLTISMPVNATVAARDVGGILKGKTATATAVVRADVSFALDRNWNGSAKVEISYDWQEPPGIEFLGQRVEFAGKADNALGKIIDKLEADLQAEVASANIRSALNDAWQEGFTVVELSKRNPPAWLRITPSGMGLAGYNVSGRKLTLTIGLLAKTETFVGDKPELPKPIALPPQIAVPEGTGLSFFMPVFADYAELEPPLLKALRKLARKGIRIEGVGSVNASFDKVIVYATDNGRLAVGIDAEVEPIGERTGISFGKTKGRVWLTGLPHTQANSRLVTVTDLRIHGDTDRLSSNLLLQLMSTDAVMSEINASLTEDFNKDYDKVLGKASRAIANKQVGRFRLSATIDSVTHEAIQVTGAGLFTPAVVTGRGQITIGPRQQG
ncbi:MAG TPA: DUF4403 family protein [Croceibacterium sp.]